MHAVVCQGLFSVAVEHAPDPRIQQPTDAIVRITTTNICGPDLHMYEGRTSVQGRHGARPREPRRRGGGRHRGRPCPGRRPGLCPVQRRLRDLPQLHRGVDVLLPAHQPDRGGGQRRKGQQIGTGQVPVKRYNRNLRDLIVAGRATPSKLVSHGLPLAEAPDTYRKLDQRQDGYTKVLLHPAA